ncbi:Alpha/Beta hydrolase protein [Gymnopilus junonius]|uniref:Carboxypeptidase n=1 Tax=Gymnopilus junonius TaxID=109634 RepID=A0A9P5NTJ0_GYMJU|nr:Alpha/Beta hydrolase protein [Gymnopilus junonius]
MTCRRLALHLAFTILTASFLPGKPPGDFSPAWQKYFLVTNKLPNVTFETGRMFAGNIPVQRPSHPNDTLFFIGVEKTPGSLTAPLNRTNRDPWGIWLNGGPGTSSMLGFFFENGPIQIKGDYSAGPNTHSWDKLADYFWIDQPVGVGFSTADPNGYAVDEDQIGKDFMGFLGNLVKVFPSLATRPLHITGESYAGQYIPYILKAYFDMKNPPVNVAKIAIGDGTYTSEPVFEFLPAVSYDQDVYNYFKEQTDLCGFNITLTYPQNGIIPDPNFIFPTEQVIPFAERRKGTKDTRKTFFHKLARRAEEETRSLVKRDREVERRLWKRDLSMRANGTIDPWYGCFLLDEFVDYAINFTFPWNLTNNPDGFPFNVYDIPDATNPKVPNDASVFLNDPRTKTALHAPTSIDWEESSDFPFGANGGNDPSRFLVSLRAINIFNALAANATARGVGVVLFSGNDDSLIPHLGTEESCKLRQLSYLQNTTFGGIQGFTRQPSTPWTNDAGEFAGVVHQERGWTYVLAYGAGHLLAETAPISAFTMLREFILGSNPTGLVKTIRPGIVTVVGGEVKSIAGNLLGADNVAYATRAAWKTFMAGNQATPAPTAHHH